MHFWLQKLFSPSYGFLPGNFVLQEPSCLKDAKPVFLLVFISVDKIFLSLFWRLFPSIIMNKTWRKLKHFQWALYKMRLKKHLFDLPLRCQMMFLILYWFKRCSLFLSWQLFPSVFWCWIQKKNPAKFYIFCLWVLMQNRFLEF